MPLIIMVDDAAKKQISSDDDDDDDDDNDNDNILILILLLLLLLRDLSISSMLRASLMIDEAAVA